MARPTDDAINNFTLAGQHIKTAGQRIKHNPSVADKQFADNELAYGLFYIAAGLSALSTGLRATYILLEEVKAAAQQRK